MVQLWRQWWRISRRLEDTVPIASVYMVRCITRSAESARELARHLNTPEFSSWTPKKQHKNWLDGGGREHYIRSPAQSLEDKQSLGESVHDDDRRFRRRNATRADRGPVKTVLGQNLAEDHRR